MQIKRSGKNSEPFKPMTFFLMCQRLQNTVYGKMADMPDGTPHLSIQIIARMIVQHIDVVDAQPAQPQRRIVIVVAGISAGRIALFIVVIIRHTGT